MEDDFNFHQAIAKATHNENFVSFLDFLGWQTIPRRNVYVKTVDRSVRRKYLRRVPQRTSVHRQGDFSIETQRRPQRHAPAFGKKPQTLSVDFR